MKVDKRFSSVQRVSKWLQEKIAVSIPLFNVLFCSSAAVALLVGICSSPLSSIVRTY